MFTCTLTFETMVCHIPLTSFAVCPHTNVSSNSIRNRDWPHIFMSQQKDYHLPLAVLVVSTYHANPFSLTHIPAFVLSYV